LNLKSLEIKYQSRREGGFKCKWDGGQIPSSVLAAAKGQVVGGREESTILESSSNNSSNKRMSRFNSNNNNNNSGSSSNNVSNINTDVPKAETNPEENSSGIYTTPTSAKTSKPEVESSNHSIPTDGSSDSPTVVVTPSTDMVVMKSVKFKIDIIPSEENTSEKTSTRVIFTQQQGNFNNFNIYYINKKPYYVNCYINKI